MADTALVFLNENVQIQQKFTFDFKKPSFTWLVAAILVQLIMTETDIECGHAKATLYVRGVNKSCKMITFSHINFSNFNDSCK